MSTMSIMSVAVTLVPPVLLLAKQGIGGSSLARLEPVRHRDRNRGHRNFGLRLPDDIALLVRSSSQRDGSNEGSKRACGEDRVGDHIDAVGVEMQCNARPALLFDPSPKE